MRVPMKPEFAYEEESIDLELLWTNPNPTTSASSISVPMDLTKYEAFIIESRCGINNSAREELGKTYRRKTLKTNESVYTNSQTTYRSLTITDSGFSFGQGGNTAGASVACCLPQRIWGLTKDILADF